MEPLFYALISLAMRWLVPRHNAQLQFLREHSDQEVRRAPCCRVYMKSGTPLGVPDVGSFTYRIHCYTAPAQKPSSDASEGQ